MTIARVLTFARLGGVAASFLLIMAVTAFAQDRRQNTPGQFDFYVLSLSWSPSYCEAARERSPGRNDPQCSGGRPFAFVVHGLWPQYETGSPAFCQVPAPRLNRSIVGDALEVMPAPGLVFHEWDRHGTCSGLSPRAYFELIRKAYSVVKIPDAYLALDKPTMVSPGDVSSAFMASNPGLKRENFAVACDRRRLTEVRICMTRDLKFHDCAEVSRRACRNDRILMPAVRGG